MTHPISINEIVETLGEGEQQVEVCATADADYDAGEQKVVVSLSAHARRAMPAGELPPLPWLPANERVTEHLPRSEAADFTKDVFSSWVKKIRAAIPRSC